MTATEAPPQAALTAETVNRALFDHFAHNGWAVLLEVSARSDDPRAGTRRIDVLLIRKARRMGLGLFELLAVEVKVSRGDFLSDVRRPEKQAPWREAAHRHVYAVPEGLVDPDEVPEESGLIVVQAKAGWNGAVSYVPRFARRAPYTNTVTEFPSWLITTMAYRASWAEAQLKGWSGVHTHGEDTVEDLRGKLRAAEQAREKAERRAHRLGAERDTWKAVFAARGGLPCHFCGEVIKPERLGRGGQFTEWVHVKAAHGVACEQARQGAAQEEAQARWDEMTEQERQGHRDRNTYWQNAPTDAELIARWVNPAPVRPSDDLLPEGATPE